MTVFPDAPITRWATGTGTDVTAFQTFTVPSGANFLAFVKGKVTPLAPAVAEGIGGIFSMGGQDWKHTPYEWPAAIGGNRLGTINGSPPMTEGQWWDCHLPVRPGSTIGVAYEPMDAVADNGEASFSCIYSSTKLGVSRQRLFTRETINTTTTGESITVTNAGSVVDFTVGMIPGGVVAADDPEVGRISATSGALVDQQTLRLDYVIHGIEATSGESMTTLSKAEIDIVVRDDPAVFTALLVEAIGPTNAGAWFYGIGYTPKVLNVA